MAQKSTPPPRLPDTFSEATADLVAAMMALDGRQRPANYAELMARIDALPCLDGAFTAAGLPVALPTGPLPGPAPAAPAPTRQPWVYALAGAVLLGGIVGAAALAGVFDRAPAPKDQPQPPPDGAKPPLPPLPPSPQALFDRQTVVRWLGQVDIEGGPFDKVLVVKGTVTRELPAERPKFLLALEFELPEGAALDAVLATGTGPAETATQWVARIDRATGAAFGTRAGPKGAFQKLGPVVRVPTVKEREAAGRPSSLALSYQRSGDKLSVAFEGEALGEAPDADMRATELRLEATGTVRIKSALLDEPAKSK